MNVITKTYVEFLTPGSFMPNEVVQEVDSRDIDKLTISKNAYAFRFYDVKVTESDDMELRGEPFNYSPRHLYGGRVMTAEDVKAEVPNSETLLRNMEWNEDYYKTVLWCRTGNFQPILENDVLVPERDPQGQRDGDGEE